MTKAIAPKKTKKTKRINKVVKLEIAKPLNLTRNEFYEHMRDIQYECWKFANRAMHMKSDFQEFDFAYKNRFGKYFFEDNKKLPNGVVLNTDISQEASVFTEKMSSGTRDALIRMVDQKWKNDLKEVLNGKRSIARFRRNIPVELHNKQMMNSKREPRIFVDEKGRYVIQITLLHQGYVKEEGLNTGRFDLHLLVKDNYQKVIVDRVMNQEYKLGMSKMIYDERKKKWFLNLTYSFEAEEKNLNKDRIMGVDLGVAIPIMLAVSDDKYFRKSIGTREEIEQFEKQVVSRQTRLQRSRTWASDGSVGRGRTARMKPLEKLSGRIANFKSTKNHAWSRAVINEAISQDCGVIQLEDLSGIAEDNAFLKRWTFFDLRTKIENKAKEVGIDVVVIEPDYTSARCSKCGHIHTAKERQASRPKQAEFCCLSCGFEANADWNAAKNISIKGIDKIIKKDLAKQKETIKHELKYLA